MEFEVDAKLFAERVAIAAESASKSVLEMAGMTIEADASRGLVTLRCAEETTAASVECPAVIRKGGEVSVSARRLHLISDVVDADEPVRVKSAGPKKDQRCIISDSADGEWALACVDPSVALSQNGEEEGAVAEISYELLRDLQTVVTPCCEKPGGPRPILSGFETTIRKDGSLCFAGTDSYRLGLLDTKPTSRSAAAAQAVLSPVIANAARHAHQELPIELTISETQATLRYGLDDDSEARLSSTVFAGDFPDWKTLLNQERPGRVTISPNDLARVIRRVQVMFDDKERATIRVQIKESTLSCFAKDPGTGEDAQDITGCSADEIAVDREDATFQATRLLQGLRGAPDEEVDIKLPEKEFAPWQVDFIAKSEAQATSLVMPVRVS